VPLLTRTVPQLTLIPLGVPVMLAMFVLLLRRVEFPLTLPTALSTASIKQISSRINWNKRVARVYLIFRCRGPLIQVEIRHLRIVRAALHVGPDVRERTSWKLVSH
jgi:hypothetical protein